MTTDNGTRQMSGHMETRIKHITNKESYIRTRSLINSLETSRFRLDVLLMRAAV